MSRTTAEASFLLFCEKFAEGLWDTWVRLPVGDELEKTTGSYGKSGFPGAMASVDCTHFDYACAFSEKNQHKGESTGIVPAACVCVCVCVFHPFLFCGLCAPFGDTTPFGDHSTFRRVSRVHTRGGNTQGHFSFCVRFCPTSSCGAYLHFIVRCTEVYSPSLFDVAHLCNGDYYLLAIYK